MLKNVEREHDGKSHPVTYAQSKKWRSASAVILQVVLKEMLMTIVGTQRYLPVG